MGDAGLANLNKLECREPRRTQGSRQREPLALRIATSFGRQFAAEYRAGNCVRKTVFRTQFSNTKQRSAEVRRPADPRFAAEYCAGNCVRKTRFRTQFLDTKQRPSRSQVYDRSRFWRIEFREFDIWI